MLRVLRLGMATSAVVGLIGLTIAASADDLAGVERVAVYKQRGRFGGWPANHGMWAWGNEMLVGFGAGYMKDNGPERHAIDHDRPEEHLLARTLDGGRSWQIENPAERGALIPVGQALHGVTPPGLTERPWQDCPGGIDFTHPDFCLTVRMTDASVGPSRFYYSHDRGREWEGPFRLPQFDLPGIAARTDYVVFGPHDCLLCVTSGKPNKREGRPLCMRTTDGGKTWKFIAWITAEPTGYGIMPSTVWLKGAGGTGDLLSAIRRRDGDDTWIELFRSPDRGKNWSAAGRVVPDTGFGNPGCLIQLADGRLALTYGVRREPWRICAKLSGDRGQTWSEEIVLRGDAGCRDLGYTQSRQRPDGRVVTVYYVSDSPQSDRYIEAAIWDPASVK